MSRYPEQQERGVHLQRLVEDWTHSGFLDATQRARLLADVQIDLRRTNRFLRFTLMGFGLLIVLAGVGLLIVMLDLDEEAAVGALCLMAAGAAAVGGDYLISRFRLYRFGIEEACAIGAVLLAGAGSGLAADAWRPPYDGTGASVQWPVLAALLAGTAAAFAVFRRHGYVYAAFAAMTGAALTPFQLGLPAGGERLVSAAVLGLCLAGARRKRRQYEDEYPGDSYGWIQAAAWAGIYITLNLRLDFAVLGRAEPAWLVWFTYVMIWLLPAAAMWFAIRERDRPLLDAGLAMALATLLTNKAYLGLERKPWDPILLGLLLVGGTIVVRRWLARGADGSRRGFTATRQLRSEKDLPAAAALVSASFPSGPEPREAESPSTDPFDGQGGRSGGGGGGGAF